MRKRVDVQAEESAKVAGEPPPETKVMDRVAAAAKLPMEDAHSEMCVALKARGYGLVRLTNVAEWDPQTRHVVAMWLTGQIDEEYVPEAVKRFRGEHDPAAPPQYAKPAAPAEPGPKTSLVEPEAPKREMRKRGSDLVQTAEGVKTRMQDEADRDQAAAHGTMRVEEMAGTLLSTATDAVTVTWGEEKYTPVPYQTFGVGPFSATVAVAPGESDAAALERAYAVLDAFAKKVKEKKLADYVEEVRKQRKMVGADGGR